MVAGVAVNFFQVNFEHDNWFDVPLEENQQIESSFCKPSNDICIVQVNSVFACRVGVSWLILVLKPLKCSGVRWLHLKLLNANQV